MIRKVKYLPFALFILLFYGCPNEEGMNIDVFYIENQSNNPFKIALYETSSNTIIGGFGLPKPKGESLSFSSEVLALSEDYVLLANNGDSAVIVLGDRYLVHKYDQEAKVFKPKEGNIFKISSYVQETPTMYRMKLTQADYESATPCNDDPICGK